VNNVVKDGVGETEDEAPVRPPLRIPETRARGNEKETAMVNPDKIA